MHYPHGRFPDWWSVGGYHAVVPPGADMQIVRRLTLVGVRPGDCSTQNIEYDRPHANGCGLRNSRHLHLLALVRR